MRGRIRSCRPRGVPGAAARRWDRPCRRPAELKCADGGGEKVDTEAEQGRDNTWGGEVCERHVAEAFAREEDLVHLGYFELRYA
eukprot:scaffold39973_cov30-Tisochrysis_lutea.AAC.4